MSQVYKRPPITEAIIQIMVKAPLADDLVERVRKRLADRLDGIVEPVMSLTEIEIEVRDARTSVKQTPPRGFRLTSKDGATVVMVFPKTITTSKLAPYAGWEPFVTAARENWDAWKRAVGYREISRIGVRYLNRIDVPLQNVEDQVRLEEYLTVSPRMPPANLPPMNHFSVNAQAPLGRENCKLILNVGSSPSPLVKAASFLLDVDIVLDSQVPQNDEGLWEVIGRMRDYKNEIFEACITDKTRALFST
jgi:uncharacterized protein (TIGR04255 family)